MNIHPPSNMCIYLTLLITKWSVWLFFDLHDSTKLPGCDAQSRMRKSPSDFSNSSVFCLGIGPWYQACERKSLESSANSHSRAFRMAMASCEIGLSIDDGESCEGRWRWEWGILMSFYLFSLCVFVSGFLTISMRSPRLLLCFFGLFIANSSYLQWINWGKCLFACFSSVQNW